MFNKLYSLTFFLIVAISNFLVAEIEYDIHDIGTLQTSLSQAIALNNQGQILGWYNIDGSKEGKHYFIREMDGTFHELPNKINGGWKINWRYLTNNGKAYGIFDGYENISILYSWDQKNGIINLGELPGKEISAINDAGQVLIKCVKEYQDDKTVIHPVIWRDGLIMKLKGLEGYAGIESDESYGFDMNNHGEVVGQSIAYISYKNKLYKQVHATKWIDGQPFDLHKMIPKSEKSSAIIINDLKEILIDSSKDPISTKYFFSKEGAIKKIDNPWISHYNSAGYFYNKQHALVFDKEDNILFHSYNFNNKLAYEYDSIWMKISQIISINDKGIILAQGETIYGEKHIMLLTPIKPN